MGNRRADLDSTAEGLAFESIVGGSEWHRPPQSKNMAYRCDSAQSWIDPGMRGLL